LHKTYVKDLNCKLYYQQLHLKCLCDLARHSLQAPWGWHDSVETCRSMIICEVIVHLLVTVENNKRNAVDVLKQKEITATFCQFGRFLEINKNLIIVSYFGRCPSRQAKSNPLPKQSFRANLNLIPRVHKFRAPGRQSD